MKLIYSRILFLFLLFSFTACDQFLQVNQDLEVTEDQIFTDWYEYRSVAMGLYALQQDLVEQIVILGELRADLLTVTKNASADLIEINNFNISKGNKYANPIKFFKLISSCNNLIRVIKKNHPEVLDRSSEITNYHKLYGEALCMRAWAYFMAVRIYKKVPFIPESLVTVSEIEAYIDTPGTYIDSIYIDYGIDGFYNDTIYNKPVKLERNLYDQDLILDHFINQLENDVFAVGVNHYIENNDVNWEIRIWNEYAYHALLGSMYLTRGDYSNAIRNFEFIIQSNNNGEIRYQLDNTFANGNWRNIFTNENIDEHILSLNFNKGNQQQNQFQSLFDIIPPHTYQMKPSQCALHKWESVFRGQNIYYDLTNPQNTKLTNPGTPGDIYRGAGVSYQYSNGYDYLSTDEVAQMLEFRKDENERSANRILADYTQPVVHKYSIGKKAYDEDADFIIYRAASIHLYVAEIYTYWKFDQGNKVGTDIFKALNIVNDGTYYSTGSSRAQKGVRGRVGLGGANDQIRIGNFRYTHNPYTNEIEGYQEISDLLGKQKWLEEEILDERARELAFEGERFYDLIRIAKRRNDPSFLARLVSEKFQESNRDRIYNHLLNENNWYINYFDR